MPDCSSVQRSLAWCQGKPELPGVKRRIYYISKYDVLQWPVLRHDANGRLTSASYVGDFVLRADASWKFIDIISDKSQLTSEAQGEYPSQTQLNKLVAVHPGVDEDASAAAAYLNNNDNVFLVEDMRGAVRVVGSDKWPTKTTVSQDLGQGATGSTSTTINVEATDECPAPFYAGTIVTDDGTINPDPATGGGNSGGGNTSGGNSGSKDRTPVYNNTVTINGSSKSVSNGSVTITGPLTSLRFTGSDMNAVFIVANGIEDEASPNSSNTVATWSGNIASGTVKVRCWRGTWDDPVEADWFTIIVNAASSGGNSGSNDKTPVYDDTVTINGTPSKVTKGSKIWWGNEITSMKFTGRNMSYLSYKADNEMETEIEINSAGTSATCNDSIKAPKTVKIFRQEGVGDDAIDVLWFTIGLVKESSSSVTAPTFSGNTSFTDTTQVTMSGPSGATIYYTTNGSTPSASSTKYVSPITLSETATLKAIAIKDGQSSAVTSRTYSKVEAGGGDEPGGDDH